MIRHGFTSHFSVQADRVRVGGPLRGKRDGEYDPRFYAVETAKWGQHAVPFEYEKEAARTDFLEFSTHIRSNSYASLGCAAIHDATYCYYSFKFFGVQQPVSKVETIFRFAAPD